jgi:hypothetical protein
MKFLKILLFHVVEHHGKKLEISVEKKSMIEVANLFQLVKMAQL